MHFFMYLFISSVYMFRASQCSSSGDRILLIHHLVWLVFVTAWYVGQEGTALQFPPDRHTKQSLTQTNHTIWCINTIGSPDYKHCDARNMERDEINKYTKKYINLVISNNLQIFSSHVGCAEFSQFEDTGSESNKIVWQQISRASSCIQVVKWQVNRLLENRLCLRYQAADFSHSRRLFF